MTTEHRLSPPPRRLENGVSAALAQSLARGLRSALFGICLALGLASCGGGGGPLNNPPTIDNPGTAGGQKLSFFYFENCINPIFDKLLPIAGTSLTNTCSGSGCHDNAAGTGGAFRVVPALNPVTDYVDITQAPAVIRATNMSKNFYSAQGEADIGTPAQSRLMIKPLVQGVLHGGGQIFVNDQDLNVKLIRYWITHPAPQGQDEFSTGAATSNMFTPPINPLTFDPSTFNPSSCNTQ